MKTQPESRRVWARQSREVCTARAADGRGSWRCGRPPKAVATKKILIDCCGLRVGSVCELQSALHGRVHGVQLILWGLCSGTAASQTLNPGHRTSLINGRRLEEERRLTDRVFLKCPDCAVSHVCGVSKMLFQVEHTLGPRSLVTYIYCLFCTTRIWEWKEVHWSLWRKRLLCLPVLS